MDGTITELPIKKIKIENLSEIEPPIKKVKIENLSEIIDKYTEKLKHVKNLKAILGDDIENPIPLMKVTIGRLMNPKDISKTIALLNERVPLKELNYLKRARKREILLCPTKDLKGSIQLFLEHNIPELTDSFDYFKEIDVPAKAPKVRKQFGSMQWYLNFHPNKYLENLVSDNFFSNNEMRFHIRIMSMIFEVVRWHLKNETKSGLLHKVNATIVVDPSIYSVVAVSFCNKDHPIQHSTMLAIDNVAKTQNGGAWGTDTHEALNCTLSGIDHDLQLHLKQEFRQISFGARVFKSKRNSNNVDETEKDVDTSESPYLCTGYHVYSLKEPCIMCSMALVHARAKRVFFCFENPEFGALKSKVKLQVVPSLNHHFEVFTGFFEKENN